VCRLAGVKACQWQVRKWVLKLPTRERGKYRWKGGKKCTCEQGKQQVAHSPNETAQVRREISGSSKGGVSEQGDASDEGADFSAA